MLYIEIHVWYIHNYKLLGIMLRMTKVEKSKICRIGPLLIRVSIFFYFEI